MEGVDSEVLGDIRQSSGGLIYLLRVDMRGALEILGLLLRSRVTADSNVFTQCGGLRWTAVAGIKAKIERAWHNPSGMLRMV